MDIVFYPDPVLQQRAEPVAEDRADLRDLTTAMLEAMSEAHGVGLAAPQVALALRLFVASETGAVVDGVVFLNPEIEPFGPIVEMEEGCLSLPGMRADIRRPEKVRVKWTDFGGRRREDEFDGLMARIIQHEYDHLEGVLFFERMQPTDRLRVRDELRAFEEQFVPR